MNMTRRRSMICCALARTAKYITCKPRLCFTSFKTRIARKMLVSETTQYAVKTSPLRTRRKGLKTLTHERRNIGMTDTTSMMLKKDEKNVRLFSHVTNLSMNSKTKTQVQMYSVTRRARHGCVVRYMISLAFVSLVRFTGGATGIFSRIVGCVSAQTTPMERRRRTRKKYVHTCYRKTLAIQCIK